MGPRRLEPAPGPVVAAERGHIGFGGAAGRAGPIVQLGSAVGSGVGQLAKLASSGVRTLVACGAAGGVAAAFNAPLAGAAFSPEIVVGRVRSDVLIVLSTALISSLVARQHPGNAPAFSLPAYDPVGAAGATLSVGGQNVSRHLLGPDGSVRRAVRPALQPVHAVGPERRLLPRRLGYRRGR